MNKRSLKRLQIYSCTIASTLSFIAYLLICYSFTDIDLLEMLITFICFILPISIAIPFYITED